LIKFVIAFGQTCLPAGRKLPLCVRPSGEKKIGSFGNCLKIRLPKRGAKPRAKIIKIQRRDFPEKRFGFRSGQTASKEKKATKGKNAKILKN